MNGWNEAVVLANSRTRPTVSLAESVVRMLDGCAAVSGGATAIVRDETVITPHSETILRARDEVLVLLAVDSEDEARAILIG